MRYSVLVPLEFHRGLASRCIRRWAEAQAYPRDEYEIVVAADETHPAAELAEIEAALSPRDRLLRHRGAHDIALVAAAALEARGQVLLFTESHCLPEPDCLAVCDEVLADHPEWGGFSGMSFPITHNLLSEIEAELYERDIASNLNLHPWLKVLDQIFVIRRDAYFATGGLEPQYGHFAEWLLAARARRCGVEIGHAPQVRIGHFYVGDLEELEEFTRDFAAGEMRFAASAANDPCGGDFPPPPEWTLRGVWDDRLVESLAEMRWRSASGGLVNCFRLAPSEGAGAAIPWTTAIRRVLGDHLEPRQASSLAEMAVEVIELLLRVALLARRRRAATRLFQAWLKAVVHWERLHCLLGPGSSRVTARSDRWSPAAAPAWSSLALHELEAFRGRPFRWSAPAACVDLGLEPGAWRLELDLLPIVGETTLGGVRFRFDGRSVRKDHVVRTTNGFALEVESRGPERSVLGWSSPKFEAPGDLRRLGLPFAGIAWQRANREGRA